AVAAVEPFPPVRPADHVRGFVLTEACRCYEFRVTGTDDREPRVQIDAEVVHTGSPREFFGFNRAKHAVLEAPILATRPHLPPAHDVLAEFRKLRVIVDKTGGPAECEAMAFLEQFRAGRTSP